MLDEKEKPFIFKKKPEDIELLTVFEAVKRYAKADEEFFIQEHKKSNARKKGEEYIPDKKFWNGCQGYKEDETYVYLALLNTEVDPKTTIYPFNYFIQKDGFHDEFKILKIDYSKYLYEKTFYWENREKYGSKKKKKLFKTSKNKNQNDKSNP
jgi:hypothetical protein